MSKKLIAGLSAFALVAASMVVVGRAHAQTDNSGTGQSQYQGTDQSGSSSAQQGSGGTNQGTSGGGTVIVPVPVNGGNNGMNLGQLFIYDQLFKTRSGSGTSAIPGLKVRSLGDLFLLGNLFGSNPFGGGSYSPYVYNGSGSGSTVVPYSGNTSPLNNLGNLFVLDRLFANGNTNSGIFGSTSNGTTNLGDLYLLNQLFNR